MSAKTRAALKLFFETGDLPTQTQFADLIDSFPNIADDMGGNPANVRNFQRLLSSAEILALQTTPINIEAAPGVGFAWQMVAGSAFYILNTTPYATDTTLRIGSDKASTTNNQYAVQVLESTASVGKGFIQAMIGVLNRNFVQDNQPLFIYAGANPTGGDGTCVVNIQYELVAIT